jgi:hypothetical protein
MRAYLSFVLVLFSLVLLFSLLQSGGHARPGNVLNERAYLVLMNGKEAMLESLRQGAMRGFKDYDASHSLEACLHCPPCHPDLCEPVLCQHCFREREAAESARQGALTQAGLLDFHSFDDDFSLSFGQIEVQAFTRPEPLSLNGFAIDSVRVNQDIEIKISSAKFGLDGSGKIPGGVVVQCR